jgi:hypothetical protein
LVRGDYGVHTVHESARPNVGIAFTWGVDKNENYDEVSNNTSTIGKGPPEKAVGKK